MQKLTLEPLRWQERPSRIEVQANGSGMQVFFQVTSPLPIEAMCCGRPVEELPRILPILAPAHHLVSAMALDRLFDVEPPPLALNMRKALLQAQYLSAHFRKIYFLLTLSENPFAAFHETGQPIRLGKGSQRMLEPVMRHAAMAQEAETILGGRADHGLTATAGGVSRFLKEGHYDRLSKISEELQAFTLQFAEWWSSAPQSMAPWLNIEVPSMTGVYLTDDGQVAMVAPNGNGEEFFPIETFLAKVAMATEPWTYQPFVRFVENKWRGVEESQGFFFVGALARFNAGRFWETSQAEAWRIKFVDLLGPLPKFTVEAAVCAMVVELIQAAETLALVGTKEKLTGPAIRTVPKKMGTAAWAALEGPQGLVFHHYDVDESGIVKHLTVMDAGVMNNALKCRMASRLVSEALDRKVNPIHIRERVAVGLLPF